jgi:methionyl-tRNA formyltransferase
VTDTPARVVFLGSGGFAVPILYRLGHLPDLEVVGVVSTQAKPAGRKGMLKSVPVANAARTRKLPLMTPPQVRDPRAIAAIRALKPDLGVLADFGQIVPQALLDVPRRGFLNIHPSLLPRHRGATPIPATILADDPIAGVTLIEMDAGLDTGPIVASEQWFLDGDETASELEARAAGVGAGLLSAWVGPWLRGEVEPTPQGDAGATLTRPLHREDGRLDVWLTARELERQVRAYQPWPGSFVETAGGRLVIWQATVEGPTDEAMPGTIDSGPGLRLATAANWLRLDEVQPAGGRRMSGEAWLRGRPSVAGSVVSTRA